MLMPCLHNGIVINLDQSPNHIQLPGSEAVVCCELDGFKPELTRLPFSSYVDVNRLVAVKAIKKEPIRSGDILDSWHSMVRYFHEQCHQVYITCQGSFNHPNALRTKDKQQAIPAPPYWEAQYVSASTYLPKQLA
jgi:hypothetical protein